LLRRSIANETCSNCILHPNQKNPAQTELAQHMIVEVTDLCYGAAALEVVAAGVDGIPVRAAGVGDHGGLSLATYHSME
jgi:hypothetical protein